MSPSTIRLKNRLTAQSRQFDKKPMSHQLEIAETESDFIYDGSATGVGKSISAISFMKAKQAKFVLVLAPVNVVTQFRDEIVSQKAGVTFIVDRKTIPEYYLLDHVVESGGVVWILTNPEILLHQPSMQKIIGLTNLLGKSGLVLDEAHQYKNLDAKRTKEAIKYSVFFQLKMLMSATPYERLLTDFYPQLTILNPDEYPPTSRAYWHFESEYTMINWHNETVNRPGAHEKLIEKIKHFYFHYTKDEVRTDMPKMIFEIVPVEAPEEIKKIANLFRLYQGRPVVIKFPDGRDIDVWIKNKLSLIAHLKKLAAIYGKKIEWVKENIHPTEDNKYLIVCEFVAEAETIAKHFGVNCISGTYNMTEDDKFGHNVVVGTVAKLKAGVSFTHINNMIIVSPNYSSVTHRQVTERCYRINSPKDVKVIQLLSSIEVDEEIYGIMSSKMDDVKKFEEISKKMLEAYNIKDI